MIGLCDHLRRMLDGNTDGEMVQRFVVVLVQTWISREFVLERKVGKPWKD